MQRIVRRLKLKIACLSANALIISYHLFLTPSPLRFFRNVFSRERLKLWFFVTFNIIIGYIFPENFIEIPQVVQKIWRFSPSMLTVFINFSYYWHFLVTKNLMTSAYNTRCQQFFCFQSTLNRLFNNCVKLY